MIFLDEQTGPELKRLLKKEIELHPKNFIVPRILKSIEADDARKQKIADCPKHDWNPMTGIKTVCNLCGGKQDGFEIWTSNEIADTTADVSQ